MPRVFTKHEGSIVSEDEKEEEEEEEEEERWRRRRMRRRCGGQYLPGAGPYP
jgi:hypothetical protein